jgi:hypothetical protein
MSIHGEGDPGTQSDWQRSTSTSKYQSTARPNVANRHGGNGQRAGYAKLAAPRRQACKTETRHPSSCRRPRSDCPGRTGSRCRLYEQTKNEELMSKARQNRHDEKHRLQRKERRSQAMRPGYRWRNRTPRKQELPRVHRADAQLRRDVPDLDLNSEARKNARE